MGHELGTTFNAKPVSDVTQIPDILKRIIAEYNLGEVEITESTDEIVQIKLRNHSSINDLLSLMKILISSTKSILFFLAS